MNKEITVAVVSTTYCRKTGKKLGSEIVETRKASEEKLYRPLVELLLKGIEEENRESRADI